MKLRIKNTNMCVEATGFTDVDEHTMVCVLDNGDIAHIAINELTNLTIKESVTEFVWSVFAKNGSRKNQVKFILSAIAIGFIIGVLII